jgi:NAD(P)-dependent dehydrogenase (short-subunit alcohol dehydrogenase family)
MANPNFSLTGRRALITGASGGLGLHFAEVLAAAGAKVVLTARRSEQLETAVAGLTAKGYQASYVTMDVVDEASVAAAFAKAEAWLRDTVDLLINNAGLSTSGKSHETTPSEWDLVMDTNLKGPWLVSRTFALRLMATNQPGAIVHIGSILGSRVAQAVPAYCASKAGLHHLTQVQALEWSRAKIRVNALSPGYIETDMNREFFASEAGQRLVSRMTARRLGQAEELDGALLLLASDAGRFINGSVLTVDGGHLASSL